MTRCLICHDPLPGDGPTCGAEMCRLAWDLITYAAEHGVATEPGPDPHRGDTLYYCEWCRQALQRTWEGDPTGPLDHSKHADDCLHKRAAALVASRGTEVDDG